MSMFDDQLTPTPPPSEPQSSQTDEAERVQPSEENVRPQPLQPTEPTRPNPDVHPEPQLPQEPEIPPTPTPVPEVPQPEPPQEAPPRPDAAQPEDPNLFEAAMRELGMGAPQRPAAQDAPSEAAPSAPAPAQPDDSHLFEEAMRELGMGDDSRDQGKGSSRLQKGERIEAEVIMVEKERVFVDLGTKIEGLIPLEELAEYGLATAVGHVQPGDKFEVVVIRPEGSEGGAIVSKKRADFDQAWDRIIKSFEEKRVFQANVIDRVKGGLVVDIGVRGFVPATHVGSGKLRNIEKFVGMTLPMKIIEVDRERKKVVLSNRLAEDEKREEVKQSIFDTVAVGDILEGTVRRLTDYGAFVDLGGIDGLLHISEMSWVRIEHPKEVLAEGDTINVMVLRLDPSGGRISLGLRQVLPDPWKLIGENYKVNQKISVTVSRFVQGGVFVKLPEGAEAFLPVSEVSNRRIKRPQEVLEENQEIEPRIIDLKPDERRMVLSLRDGPSSDLGFSFDDGSRGKRGAGRKGGGKHHRGGEGFEPQQTTRTPTGGATIGERLGALRGLIRSEEAEAAPPAEAEAPVEAKKPRAPRERAPTSSEAPPPEAMKPEAPKAEEPNAEVTPAEAPRAETSESKPEAESEA